MIHHLNIVFEESQKLIPLENGLPRRQITRKTVKKKCRNKLPLRTNRRRKLKVNLTRTRKRQSEENSCIIIDGTCDIPVEINEVLKDACTGKYRFMMYYIKQFINKTWANLY